MSQACVVFSFKDKNAKIECLTTEKLIQIYEKFADETKVDISK